MNLKYYLKGLGLGIIVTALILGIHYKNSGSTMTDAEIKARAAELGMVEESSKLAENDDDVTAQELLDDMEKEKEEESSTSDDTDETLSEAADEAADETLDEAAGDVSSDEADDAGSDESDKEDVELENTRIDSVTDADDDPDRKSGSDSDEQDTEEISSDEDEDTESAEEQPSSDDSEDQAEKPSTQSQTGVLLTISSGDSSDRVAKKLADMGLVLDASEYDTYLCTYGYDRLIRTGTYTIPDGASNEEIAKIITGKK